MLSASHISFSYGNTKVIDDLTFDFSSGEIIALTGANGAGKTTLLRMLAGLTMPDSGHIMFEGVDIWDRPLYYRKNMGYMPETSGVYQGMTVRSYLSYRAALKGEHTLRIRRKVREAATQCGLSDYLSIKTETLSLGLRKRLLLADAILSHPRVLLLDDVLAGLDQTARALVASLLIELSSRSTIIVSGHDIEDMRRFCTSFLHLESIELPED